MALTSAYDPIFRRYAGRLPVAYLRALAQRESDFQTDLAMPGGDGAAKGILQVVGVVRDDFNARHGTSYTSDDLFNPEVNVQMAAELINMIVAGYQKHPSANMKENWSNPEFVKLVTAGWNSGFSEAGGVGRVASYLEAQGIPVTHDSVFANAAAAGATSNLSENDRLIWQRSVVDLYYQQPDWGSVGIGIGTVALSLLAAWAAYELLT